VLNREVLLTRAAAKDGRLVLPDGMSYRYLVLPQAVGTFSPPVHRKIEELGKGGVRVIESNGPTLAEIVTADRLPADIEFRTTTEESRLDWIHRRAGETEIYFVANLASEPAAAEVLFRVTGKQPELWDAVTGDIRYLTEWRFENGRTAVPLVFEPRQSWFIVFRKEAQGVDSRGPANIPKLEPLAEIAGPWQVSFDPKWGGPQQVAFDSLDDCSKRPEDGIKYYSGIATYKKSFNLPQAVTQNSRPRIYLDLGSVRNVSRVKLNDQDLGVVWTAPWHLEVTAAIHPGANELEIEVANLWPNRLIGDAGLPKEKRLTKTNVQTYDRSAGLLPSGLLGPVTLRAEAVLPAETTH
jgi:hypothetical protein